MNNPDRMNKARKFFITVVCFLYSLYVSFTVASKYIKPDGLDGIFRVMAIEPYGLPGIFWAMVFSVVTGMVVGLLTGGLMGIFAFGYILGPVSAISNAVVTTIVAAVLSSPGLPEWLSLIIPLIPGTWVGTALLCVFFYDLCD